MGIALLLLPLFGVRKEPKFRFRATCVIVKERENELLVARKLSRSEIGGTRSNHARASKSRRSFCFSLFLVSGRNRRFDSARRAQTNLRISRETDLRTEALAKRDRRHPLEPCESAKVKEKLLLLPLFGVGKEPKFRFRATCVIVKERENELLVARKLSRSEIGGTRSNHARASKSRRSFCFSLFLVSGRKLCLRRGEADALIIKRGMPDFSLFRNQKLCLGK